MAGAVRDAAGCSARPGAVAVRDGRILAAGPVDAVLASAGPQAQRLDLPDQLILPRMVNAHAHLDLTALGPQPYEGDFTAWASSVMQARATAGTTPAEAVRQGAAMSLASGVGWVGDIAGSLEAAEALAASDLPGVAYLECFGHGQRAQASAQRLAEVVRQGLASSHVRLGLQPHAPYSAGLELYRAAVELAERHDLPLATHLAETVDEITFVRHASGPWAQRLRQWGKWDDAIQPRQCHPVDHLAPVLRQRRWLLAHCNYLDAGHAELLAAMGASVAYCPRASEYFGHHDHPYHRLLAAGVNVCLGVDSILCQPPAEPQPLGLLPVLRRLYRRDGCEPDLLLKMATVNGLIALGLDPALATLSPGVPARLAAVPFDPGNSQDPLRQALHSRYPLMPLEPS